MRNIIIILLISYSSISSSKSGWPKKAINIANKFKYPFNNSYSGTVWSSCNSRSDNNIKLPGKLIEKYFDNPYFENKKFNSTFILQQDGEKFKKAPTIVLINGLFGDPLSGVARQLANVLLNTGHNIIALGNPLGPKNIAQKPNYPIGNFIKEGEAFLINVKNAINWLNSENLVEGDVEIVSVSYGSFVGAIIKALDSQSETPLLKGPLTLLSPALEMDVALYNMDDLLIESQPVGKLADWMIMFKSIRYCYLPLKKEPGKKQLMTLKAIFSYLGFQRWLADQTIVIDKMYDLNKVPVDKQKRTKWRRTFSFRDYLNNFSPELRDLMTSKKGKLMFWLNQLPENDYRILTTLDDPLNFGIQEHWPDFDNVILLPKGGHYGLRAFPFFEEFLKTSFSKENLL